jgi:hypothetical protein
MPVGDWMIGWIPWTPNSETFQFVGKQLLNTTKKIL